MSKISDKSDKFLLHYSNFFRGLLFIGTQCSFFLTELKPVKRNRGVAFISRSHFHVRYLRRFNLFEFYYEPFYVCGYDCSPVTDITVTTQSIAVNSQSSASRDLTQNVRTACFRRKHLLKWPTVCTEARLIPHLAVPLSLEFSL